MNLDLVIVSTLRIHQIEAIAVNEKKQDAGNADLTNRMTKMESEIQSVRSRRSESVPAGAGDTRQDIDK